MNEEKTAIRTIKRIAGVALVCAAALAIALCGVCLWADTLYRSAFDGRTATVQAESDTVTSFDLLAQETAHQTQSRVSGWHSAVASQEVSISASRGRLQATVYDPLNADENAPWAIVLHGGLGTDRTSVLDIACALSIRGYRVLTPDLYAHGASDGDASTLGYEDAQDVAAWVEYVEQTQMGAHIVLLGVDEGANAVLLAACDGLSESVVAVAADSAGNDPVRCMLERSGREDTVDRMLLRGAFGRRAASEPISQRIGEAKIPLLIIHGTGDQLVPAWNSEDIAAAAGDGAQLLLIEGAGHTMARHLNPQTYYNTLFEFFEAALNED